VKVMALACAVAMAAGCGAPKAASGLAGRSRGPGCGNGLRDHTWIARREVDAETFCPRADTM
jgi:hypothetical protein